jgi:23S rRNA pseudouridine2605 synthase
MRLAKYLAHAGVASRRSAEDLIRAGRVSVDGEVVSDLGRQVDGQEVRVDGEVVRGAEERAVWLVNKPIGVVSTARDTHGRPTVVELVPNDAGARLYPVGRLDADTTGLILVTNDGELAHRLTHPSFEVPRVYIAKVADPPVSDRALRALREGVELDDGVSAPAQAERLAPNRIELILHEGRKRQVKRMCEAVGHRVLELKRVRFGPLELGRLHSGGARRLSAAEVSALNEATRGG